MGLIAIFGLKLCALLDHRRATIAMLLRLPMTLGNRQQTAADLCVVHESRAETLDLLMRCHCAEGDLAKTLQVQETDMSQGPTIVLVYSQWRGLNLRLAVSTAEVLAEQAHWHAGSCCCTNATALRQSPDHCGCKTTAHTKTWVRRSITLLWRNNVTKTIRQNLFFHGRLKR